MNKCQLKENTLKSMGEGLEVMTSRAALARNFLLSLFMVWVSVSSLRSEIGEFEPRSVGYPVVGMPWITDLHIVDLDTDGLLDVVVCDGRLNKVSWIRQEEIGVYIERDIGKPISGPAHVETADLDEDGDLDVLVAGMGIVTPNNDRIGSVVVLENLGDGQFANRVLLEKTPRVTYVNAGDLDGDGDLDLSVGQFGYFEGETRWMENLGDWQFASHPLLNYSGTIHAPIVDFDGDGDLDLLALVAQDWEEIHSFENDGKGGFTQTVAYGALNRDYGSSGISISDIDEDGDPDIAYTNGDGFDYATPGSRSWHGVQWLENDGLGKFKYHRIGDLPGAYSPVVVDIDNDSDLDVIAVSGFNEWNKDDAVSMMCFERGPGNTFTPVVLAHWPTHLVVVDAADMDQDGEIELVTGGFHIYPPYENASRVMLWDQPASVGNQADD